MQYQIEILNFIDVSLVNPNPYFERISHLREKLINAELSRQDKLDLIELVLEPNLDFDDLGEPRGKTTSIERIIDYLSKDIYI